MQGVQLALRVEGAAGGDDGLGCDQASEEAVPAAPWTGDESIVACRDGLDPIRYPAMPTTIRATTAAAIIGILTFLDTTSVGWLTIEGPCAAILAVLIAGMLVVEA